ncbi:hypothetical protein V8C86DRAFT_3026766 [Haematococcus lacustris]
MATSSELNSFQHPIYVVHCYEHILHNARQGHNSALCWLLDHVSMVFRKHPPPGSRKVEEACLTRWGTYCRIAVWVLEYYQPMLEVLQPLCLADSIAGQQKVYQCLFAELLKPVHMVQCAVLAALNRAVLEEQQLWAQSNSSRWMCHWHTHHEHIMCVLLAATVEPRMVLREAYSLGCSMVWGPGDSQGAVGEPVTAEQVDELVLELQPGSEELAECCSISQPLDLPLTWRTTLCSSSSSKLICRSWRQQA